MTETTAGLRADEDCLLLLLDELLMKIKIVGLENLVTAVMNGNLLRNNLLPT